MFTVRPRRVLSRPYRWARCCWLPPAGVAVLRGHSGGWRLKSEAAVDLTKQGDIEYWQGKDVTGPSRS